MKKKGNLLILGIDGMDAATTLRMVNEGKLPNIKKYLDRGAAREDLQLLGALPTITPPCWTTLATGAYPSTHGITCYWRQSPDNLDAVVYNMDSRNCKAEPLWDVTAREGRKTLVWHWPGSSWPPTSDSPNLSVVDGTQPGSVNMGVSQMDWEKIITASRDRDRLDYSPHTEKRVGVGCNIMDLEEVAGSLAGEEDEMMELWWGDAARKGGEIRTYVNDLNDTEMIIGARVAYDIVLSPLTPAAGWKDAPEGSLEFLILTSGGANKRYALLTHAPDNGGYIVKVYRDKTDTKPIVTITEGQIAGAVDDVTKRGVTKPAYRNYKILEATDERVRLWISNALDITNDSLWHPASLYEKITGSVGYVPPVSLIGGEDAELVERVFVPSWEEYNLWQAKALNELINEEGYEVVFSHLHNVDCAGHQLWHLAKNLEPWKHTDEKTYQRFIEEIYVQTDRYLGEFLYLLEEDWTVFILSDHGLLVGENVPPILGEYGGLNVPVMEELGYTVLKKDAAGNKIQEVDWTRTRAVQIRSNYVYVNLRGRNPEGIVTPEERYDLEEQIISDLYGYREPVTGKRAVGIAMRNKDAIALGVGGPEAGDIFFTVEEGFNRLHGDGLSTARGFFGTSVTPVFIAAGRGIKPGCQTERVIRQVDVAPTAARILDVQEPAQSEGGILHQILQ
jgi:predicted AlkP superfamily phosphohydrolase/phosphomutase